MLLAGLVAPSAQAAVACRAATPAEASVYTSPVMMPGVVSPQDGTCFLNNLRITSRDGTVLTANVFLPAGATGGVKTGSGKPAVTFITSWAFADWFEYLGAQRKFAQNGYIALAYTARGFWASGGTVNVVAPNDIADYSAVLDWVVANTPADANRLGTTGISYGAGISLIGAASDKRVKAIAAMSGWGMLVDQLFANDVPNVTWTAILNALGQLTGRMDPVVQQLTNQLNDPAITQAQVQVARDWAAPRSPGNYVSQLNANQTAVFLSKNWSDDMFVPNSMMALYSRLTTPKMLLLQPGIHGTAELSGAMFGGDNAVYNQALRWFDRYLKGVPNGIDAEPKLRLRPKFASDYESLSDWPAPELKKTTFNLGARGNYRWDASCICFRGATGSLTPGNPGAWGSDSFNNLIDTTATTGFLPVVSVTAESIGVPVLNQQDSIARDNGIRYESAPLPNGMRIRGIPELKLRVKPSQARGMLVAYLYSVDAFGWGTLISHGARSNHWATPGQTIDYSFNLNATAYDVPAGNKLALVFDSADNLYGSPVRLGEVFSMALEAGSGSGASLTLTTR